eukprot:m.118006 g.118006  ORF g.118006 m.118006 type:complete len:154 (+) comp16417_c2_seq1:890-1351(+)
MAQGSAGCCCGNPEPMPTQDRRYAQPFHPQLSQTTHITPTPTYPTETPGRLGAVDDSLAVRRTLQFEPATPQAQHLLDPRVARGGGISSGLSPVLPSRSTAAAVAANDVAPAPRLSRGVRAVPDKSNWWQELWEASEACDDDLDVDESTPLRV